MAKQTSSAPELEKTTKNTNIIWRLAIEMGETNC